MVSVCYCPVAVTIDDQVVEFNYALFGRLFSEPVKAEVHALRKRNAVLRQVDESAEAASQSLTRFFLNQQLTEQETADVLGGLARLGDLLDVDEIANPNVTPEGVVAELLEHLPCPAVVETAGRAEVYRVAMHSVVQVLMLVGPVMKEWRRLNFASTYELPGRVVARLNEITARLAEFAGAREDAADERYELTYRDYLLQRFYRGEAGTVRMTTNLAMDLRELFVMPKVAVRPAPKKGKTDDAAGANEVLMDLTDARAFFGQEEEREKHAKKKKRKPKGISALDQVRRHRRCVIVGAPGGGKSTFLEWLQLCVANADQDFVLGDQQAIPLLLRVRQLDAANLPLGPQLIEKATGSR
ncbi:MAG: hypothetical protein IID34_15865, partial [Planctomycetes bacterium]|nr:hypothetical protein [Planctomycetota bacterium]